MKHIILRYLTLLTLLTFTALWAGDGDHANSPTVTISTETARITEGDSGTTSFTVTATLDECPNAYASQIKLKLQTKAGAGTARADVDYKSQSYDLVFNKVNCTLSQRKTFYIIGDPTFEDPDETFFIEVVNNGTPHAQIIHGVNSFIKIIDFYFSIFRRII